MYLGISVLRVQVQECIHTHVQEQLCVARHDPFVLKISINIGKDPKNLAAKDVRVLEEVYAEFDNFTIQQ